MCRLLGVVRGSNEEVRHALSSFRKLAECGEVPDGMSEGHKDGWGIAAYNDAKLFITERGVGDAMTDDRYATAEEAVVAREHRGIVVAHVRKTLADDRTPENTHPFVKGHYILGLNGGVAAGDKLPLAPAFRKLAKGSTDTEKFFLYIVQQTAGVKTARAVRRALAKAVGYVREHFDFAAMNILLSNGRFLWATRIVNGRNAFIKEKDLMDHFSLYHGHNHDGVQMVSSEKLAVPGITWTKLVNNSLIELDSKTYKVATMKI